MRTRNLITLFSVLVFLTFAAMGCGGGGSGDSGGNGSLPTASITANPESIQAGQSAVISWSTDGGTVSIPGIGSDLAANGSANVSPAATTTYTVTVTAPDSQVATASVTVNVTPVATLWKVPANYTLYFVATDGNLVVRAGYKVIDTNPPTNLSVIVCYNSDGTTRWTKEFSYVDYSTSKSVIANGSLYALKVVGVFPPGWPIGNLPQSYDIYIDRFSLADGTAIGSSFFVGNTVDYASIAADSSGIFVSLDYENWTADVFKLDLSLSSKSKILTFPGNIRNMTISAGNLGLGGMEPSSDGLQYLEALAMVYTTAGTPVWANPQIYYPATGTYSLGNAVAFSGGYVYLTGYTMVLPPVTGTYPPFLRKYNAANGSFVSAVSFTAEQTANDLAFSPSGNIFVAISGAASPVALDVNGNVLWTGTAAISNNGRSLVYFQGKVITQDSVYDAVTGQKLF